MMPKRLPRFSLSLLFSLLLYPFVTVLAGYNIGENNLSNGIKILTYEDHSVPLVGVMFVFNVGIKNEPAGLTGLTRLCDNILQSGTASHKRGDFSRIIQTGGGESRSFVDADYTAYVTKIPTRMIDTLLMLWVDRLQNCNPTYEKLLLARDALRKERISYVEGSIYGHINEEIMNLAYRSHPYRTPSYGWPQDLDNINLDDLKKYLRLYFQPSNLTIIVAGDFKTEEIVGRIDSLFANIISVPVPPERNIIEPTHISERCSYLEGPAGIPAFIIGYHIPPTSHEDTPAIRLLSYILSISESSRIQQRMMSKEKSAFRARGGMISYKGPSLLFAYAILNYDTPNEVGVAQMDEEIQRLKDEPVTEAELEAAKNQLEAEYFRRMRTLDGMAYSIAYMNLIYSDWRWIDSTVIQARAVTAEDISDVAQKYLDRSNRVVVYLKPVEDDDAHEGGEE